MNRVEAPSSILNPDDMADVLYRSCEQTNDVQALILHLLGHLPLDRYEKVFDAWRDDYDMNNQLAKALGDHQAAEVE